MGRVSRRTFTRSCPDQSEGETRPPAVTITAWVQSLSKPISCSLMRSGASGSGDWAALRAPSRNATPGSSVMSRQGAKERLRETRSTRCALRPWRAGSMMKRRPPAGTSLWSGCGTIEGLNKAADSSAYSPENSAPMSICRAWVSGRCGEDVLLHLGEMGEQDRLDVQVTAIEPGVKLLQFQLDLSLGQCQRPPDDRRDPLRAVRDEGADDDARRCQAARRIAWRRMRRRLMWAKAAGGRSDIQRSSFQRESEGRRASTRLRRFHSRGPGAGRRRNRPLRGVVQWKPQIIPAEEPFKRPPGLA